MRNCLLLILALFLLPYAARSQQPVEMAFEHDAAGNMVRCYVVRLEQPKSEKSAKAETLAPQHIASNAAAQSTAPEPEPVEVQRGERTVRIYPNPTRGQLRVEVQGDGQAYSYRLLGMGGALIAQGQHDGGSPLPLDLSAQPDGAYLLQLIWPDDRCTYKIIKN
ncbi:MAG: T9SS type A sorting domain-containing protein [Bacteroidales bacterium]|nr:T9SS type A sorting domain-containing protein [Bacteroidales bacterium]